MSLSTDRQVDSPMAITYIPITFDNSRADESALELAYAFNPAWRSSEGEVQITRFTDGITNTLSKATKLWPGKTESQNDDDAILMRAYGKGTDVLIDREREMRAHEQLASMGLAPPLLARFNNGLIYRFVQGDVCTPEDLRRPDVYRQTARLLGQWHGSLPISAIASTPDLKLEAHRKHAGVVTDGRPARPIPNIWSVMQQWIDALPSSTEEERRRNKVLDGELAELSSRFGSTPGLGGKDYIFSHCDLLSGNVIMQKPSGVELNGDSKDRPVSFIDYEYSTPGPAAFDISNHFAEWAGFECDHGAVPTRSQRRDFLRHYVASFRYHSIDLEGNMNYEIDFQQDIDQLYNQIEDFRGLPGFYWGIWALIQATISQIDFDYETYAELRLGEYWAWKAESDGSRARDGREIPLRERRWAEE